MLFTDYACIVIVIISILLVCLTSNNSKDIENGEFRDLDTAISSISVFSGFFDTDNNGEEYFWGTTRSGEY